VSLFKKRELFLLVLHLAIGFIVFAIPFSSKLINILLIGGSFLYVFSAKNKTFAILLACAYLSTGDVFFRMTNGFILYESRKYLLIVFVFIGLFYEFSKSKGYIYILYIFLLLFTIIITEYDLEEEIRKMIAFNLSGPISLGFFAFYCYRRKVTMQELSKILFYATLPVVPMLVYLYLYTPSTKEVVMSTASNFDTSGGFGPNQVATTLGIGIFVFITRLVLNKVTKTQSVLEFLILGACVFRGLVTFSRGGVLAALIAAGFFIAITFLRGNKALMFKINKMIIVFFLTGIGVWFYTVSQTSGMIENRYLNQNAAGIEKEDVTTGRVDIAALEFQAFLDNPIFGLGVGKGKHYRFERTGVVAASHNEIGRILSEHGAFGMFAFLILFLTPLVFRLQNRNNIYFYSFFLLWFLTINHSAMRIAFPSFIYGLCLLDVTFEKKQKTLKK